VKQKTVKYMSRENSVGDWGRGFYERQNSSSGGDGSEGKRSLGRHRRRWGIILRWIFT
jgi:hypothetical protein